MKRGLPFLGKTSPVTTFKYVTSDALRFNYVVKRGIRIQDKSRESDILKHFKQRVDNRVPNHIFLPEFNDSHSFIRIFLHPLNNKVET